MDALTKVEPKAAVSPANVPAKIPGFASLKELETPSHMRLLSWLLAGLLGAVIAGLIFIPWVQTVDGDGRVIAFAPMERQQTIDAPIEGRIVRWLVVEGTKVKEGDVVAEMSDNDPNILLHLEQERSSVVNRQQAAVSRDVSLGERIVGLEGSRLNALSAADSRIAMAKDRVRAAEQAVEAAEATLRTTSLNIERQKRLVQKGLTSTRNVELAELDQARAVTELDRAKASLNAARNERIALEADRQKTETDFKSSIEDARASRAAAKAEIANALGELQRMEVRLSRQKAQVVKAPRSGTIFRLLEQPAGSLVKTGEAIAQFIPENSQPVVELWVKGNDVPLLSEGRHVRLQFEGWPALQFSGWPSVAVGTFGGKVMLVDATDNGQGKFRILVAPDETQESWPGKQYMRQGVRANGWVLLNSVPLWYELWRQFNGFPPVIASNEPGAKSKK